MQRSLCVPLRSSRAGGRTGRHRDAPRRWHTSCLLSPTVLVAGVLVPHWGLKRGLPSCPQLWTVQVGAPSTGPASCHAGPKRKPRRGVPTEPEGARSSLPRANGQCKSHQVSITHAGDSRNSLFGGLAVRGTWVLYLRGSIYVGDITHSAQVGSARNGDMLNAWGHVAASRWVGAPAPSMCPRLWRWHWLHRRENVSTDWGPKDMSPEPLWPGPGTPCVHPSIPRPPGELRDGNSRPSHLPKVPH